MSPRRSSRARTTQPPPSVPTYSNSSTSTSSSRGDRATRSVNKQGSPRKSVSPQSLSSEDLDNAARAPFSEPPQTRRSKRGQDAEDDDDVKMDAELGDEAGDEEEITRCVCGHQEYPGPPDLGSGRHGKSGHAVSSFGGADLQSDEAGGLFIQCDMCKVWQHGGCVGIMDEAASPEEYFCEQCRSDLHQIFKSGSGQRSSRYLPVYNEQQALKASTRKTSVAKDDKAFKEKEKVRASADASAKRRSTMNSRAAYDEDEVLRKVLEESKADGGALSIDNGSRKSKRGREESEDMKPGIKRQRTGSGSSSSPGLISPLESEDEQQAVKSTANGSRKPRGASARSQKGKELREQRERQREEAARNRKGRVDRRRADDSELPEITKSTETPQKPDPSASQPPPDTPSTSTVASKKSARPTQKRTGRLGNNQYTRNRDRDNPTPDTADVPSPKRNGASSTVPSAIPTNPNPTNGTSNIHSKSSSPSATGGGGRTNGHDTNGSGGDSAGSAGSGHGSVAGGKSRKAGGAAGLNKMSMNEARRRVAGYLAYIQRAQMEMASQMQVAIREAIGRMRRERGEVVDDTIGAAGGVGGLLASAVGGGGLSGGDVVSEESEEDDIFKQVGLVGMRELKGWSVVQQMDYLTKHLVLWQNEHGK